MSRYGAYADDYYVNMNLNTEMDLPTARETVLHFFEQLQRHFPGLRHFYTRPNSEIVLEEEKDGGSYRWITIEPRRLSSGYVNPPSVEEAMKLHNVVLELAPFALAVSPLDCESLNIMYGFDFTFRGNQNQLLVDALGISPALEKMAQIPGATVLGCDPMLQLAMDEECRTQVRLSMETRTTAFQVRTRDFPEEQLSVYLTARRYGSLEGGDTFVSAAGRLAEICRDLVDNYVVENVLRPLQQTIAMG
jgi:hypothetical protein